MGSVTTNSTDIDVSFRYVERGTPLPSRPDEPRVVERGFWRCFATLHTDNTNRHTFGGAGRTAEAAFSRAIALGAEYGWVPMKGDKKNAR